MSKIFIFDLDDTLYDTSTRLDSVTPNFPAMKLYPDAKVILENQTIKKILVTHGEKETQDKKIDVLKIRGYFGEIYICENRFDKLDCFKKILEKHKIDNPKDVFVVGDRIDSEIKYGNMLGMTTVYLNRGKYMDLKPKDKNEVSEIKIQSLEELMALC